jgi:predicted dehydrogenase
MKVRWGLIGCGDIARKRVAPALASAEGCELIAVSRARADLAEAFAQEFGARRWYAGAQEMLGDGEIDAIYIATPVHLHRDQTVAAAAAGKHVLCEKPMALNVDECEDMIASCEKSGVFLGIAYYRHFYPVVRRIKEILASGKIGRPVLAELRAFERFNPPLGAERSWLLDPEQAGGGPMMDFGCHRFEILINILGEPSGVQGLTTSAAFSRRVEDTATAMLSFQGGAQGVVIVSHATFASKDTLDIYGTEGSLHVSILNEGVLRIVTRDGERVENLPPHGNIHQPLIEDFARAVIERRHPKVDGALGRSVSAAIARVYDQTLGGG